jgi:hypothetical protein
MEALLVAPDEVPVGFRDAQQDDFSALVLAHQTQHVVMLQTCHSDPEGLTLNLQTDEQRKSEDQAFGIRETETGAGIHGFFLLKVRIDINLKGYSNRGQEGYPG